MEVWLQLFWIQLPQLNSFLPHPKYKSLCDWSTQNVHYVLPSLSTGVSCLPFPPLQRIKHLVFWTVPHREGTGTPYKELHGTFQHLCRKVSAIHVTEKTMHELLVLVSGLLSTTFLWLCPWRLHSHHFTLLLILEIINLRWKGPPSEKTICLKPVVKVMSAGTLMKTWDCNLWK